MSRARHRRAKVPLHVRGVAKLAVPVVVVATAPVAVAVWPDSSDDPPAADPVTIIGDAQRSVPVSRYLGDRTPAPVPVPSMSATVTLPTATPTPTPTATKTPTPEPTAAGEMYVTAGLNVRTEPKGAEVLTVLELGTKVDVTGGTDGSWVEIIYDDDAAWVSGDYLSETEPEPDEANDGISYAECASGSAVESGLTPDAIRVHRAICAQFPSVDSYGGVRPGGEHGQGRALDAMVSSSSLGDAIAEWVRENHEPLGVSEVIWAQQIWTVERSSDGWRWMEDRGSATANHYDHVHVTVYGNAGG